MTFKSIILCFTISSIIFTSGCGSSYGTVVGGDLAIGTLTTPILTTLVSGLTSPQGVAVDDSGNVYVSDGYNFRYALINNAYFNYAMKKWEKSTNSVTTLVSSNGPFTSPIAVDKNGNIYFVNSSYNASLGLFQISSLNKWIQGSNSITTLISSGLAGLNNIAVDTVGNVYFSDTNLIKAWTPSTNTVSTLVSGQFASNIAVDVNGNIYFAPITSSGSSVTIMEWVKKTNTLITLVSNVQASAIAVDINGNVYFSDINTETNKEWMPSTNSIITLPGPGGFTSGIAVDTDGNVYFTSSVTKTLYSLTCPTGMRLNAGACN